MDEELALPMEWSEKLVASAAEARRVLVSALGGMSVIGRRRKLTLICAAGDIEILADELYRIADNTDLPDHVRNSARGALIAGSLYGTGCV